MFKFFVWANGIVALTSKTTLLRGREIFNAHAVKI